jgi:molybdate transport system substrate-binding protein
MTTITFFRTLLLVAVATFMASCSEQPAEQAAETTSPPVVTLKIAGAASTQFCMEELAAAFEKKTGIKSEFTFGSSGKLSTQIAQGAPYDLFFSANMRYANYLQDSSESALGQSQKYARGAMVLWSMDTTLVLDSTNWNKLFTDKKIEKIAIADPVSAPVGQLAKQFLNDKGIWEKVESKVVYGSSIAQVNQYLTSNLAQLALTGLAVVKADELKGIGKWVEVPGYFVDQGGIVLKASETNGSLEQSKAFMDFVLNDPEARSIMEKHGYK